MKNEVWKKFEVTGSIENYLEYKSYIQNEEKAKEVLKSDIMEISIIE